MKTFRDAMIAKLTVKKLLSQIDHVETALLTAGTEPSLKFAVADWLTEMRLHLRRLELWAEQTV
jgi:hypothetical protein